jgi:predicted Rossmann fold nucleotide-binding protein DprA/Smf involved in DNA uptake
VGLAHSLQNLHQLDGKETMPSTNNVLDEARQLVTKRLADLDEERKRLERALAELGGKATRRAPGRPRGSSPAPKSAGTRKRRKRRGGTRADQAVSLIEKEPGISASDVAKTMKIKPNYLYRVLGDLEKEGRVKKQGRQYFPGS